MGPSNVVGGLSTDTRDKRHRISLLHYISLASKTFLGFFAVSSLRPDDPPTNECASSRTFFTIELGTNNFSISWPSSWLTWYNKSLLM
ncbi:hypothetical protein FKM82_028200 [Ascaphus truei]